MADLKSVVAEKLPLTMGETIALAKEYGVRVVDVVLTESELRTGLDREGVLKAVMEEYAHNLKAVEIGVSGGNSFLLGTVPTQLKEMGPGTIFADVLLDKALMYTVAAEVGNHCIGVRPCAGTGDPCPYTGFLRALMDVGTDETTLAEVACLMLKVGSLCFAFTFQCCGKAVGSAGSLRYGGSFGSYAVCCFCCVFCGSQDCTQFGISRLQVRSNVFCVVCFPEFQVGRTL